jgi:PAS domain S-box-containing protein
MPQPIPDWTRGARKSALRDLPIACHEVNLDGRITWVNPAGCRLLDLPAEQILHRSVWEFAPPGEQTAGRLATARKLSAETPLAVFERPYLRSDGAILQIEVHEQYRRSRDGRILGIRSFLLDITARRRAEDALRKVQEDLESVVDARTQELELAIDFLRREIDERRLADKEHRKLEAQVQHSRRLESMGVLAGGVAHKFNNLLTSIMGYASLAAAEVPEGSRAKDHVEQVLAASASAAELTQQMLAYAGRGRFVFEELDLSRTIEQTMRLLVSAISRDARLSLDLAADLPLIEGDAGQLRQMLLNLANNASDALAGRLGEISIRTGLMWAETGELMSLQSGHVVPSGLYVYVEVADTGSGMDASTLGKIFDPFFTTKFAGRGLGLSAVMGIARAHHGSIRVDSTPGQGTAVRVYFPTLENAAPQTAPARSAETIAQPRTGAVLVVDDEEPIRRLAQTVLEDAGFTVLPAADGWQALQVFREHRHEIHAVLLDLTMPGMDGAEVFQAIHQLQPESRVLLCSGYNELEVASRLGAKRPSAFLRKPYCPRELLELLRSVW